MSTERDDDTTDPAEPTTEPEPAHDPDAPGRPARRSRLLVTAVAAAVLLAGGGGAYWAATADDGGGSKAAPAPLKLTGATGEDAPAQNGTGDSGTSGGTGTTPGTGSAPADGAGGGTYTLTGSLPKGPDSAAVYRGHGPVGAADVQRLAKLLGMSGTAVAQGDSWRVGPANGAGPTLLVTKAAPGTWSYSRYGASGVGPVQPGGPAYPPLPVDPGGPRKMVPMKPQSDGGTGSDSGTDSGTASTQAPSPQPPVSVQRAEDAAAPVLSGLGLSGARVHADETVGAVRVVSADPVVDGLPTHGWSTDLDIASDGRITLGHGRLATLDKGDSYPVVSAAQALKELNGHVMHPDHGIAACPAQSAPKPSPTPTTTLPGQDKTLPHTLPCVPGNGHPLQVRGAVFGLTLDYVSGAQALVPAWLFDVAQPGVSRTGVVAQTAVDPKYIQRDAPGQPTDPKLRHRTVGLSTYHADGRTLELTFYGGVCSTYSAKAAESAGQVRVTVTSTEKEGTVCVALAKKFTEKVTLDKPLGGRTVVDTSDGKPLTAR
ncbi:hypothetical protein SAMN05216251_10730 [Actinacidiphila alni]|uniref:Large membrane protein n=1 Tax=Actinacidiphila alni TaxID=380248 RepID=A0A1I2EWG1_9ACTN|nr:hypothetical protein [Actinacidiphila alni]SFE97454.1 hypothetical protein SAMN05216251_10730 [Actinacidiphila alni]